MALIAGSTNTLVYIPKSAGVTVQPTSSSVVVKDAAGVTVTVAGTPAWDATDQALKLVLQPSEVPAAAAGEAWTFAWTWAYGGQTLRDVESVEVVESDEAAGSADLCTLAEVKAQLPDSISGDFDALLATLITAASASIRGYRGMPDTVTIPAVTETRTVYAFGEKTIYPAELLTVTMVTAPDGTELTLATDTLARGQYLPVLAADGYVSWIELAGRATGPVAITGVWGFATVPTLLRQACIDTVCDIFKSRHAQFAGGLDGSRMWREKGESLPALVTASLKDWADRWKAPL